MKNLCKLVLVVAAFVAPLAQAKCRGGRCNRGRQSTVVTCKSGSCAVKAAAVSRCANGSCRR